MKQHGKKYQTNFFISNKDVEEARVRYGYNNAKYYADKIYDAVIARKSDILNIDYFGKDNVNEDLRQIMKKNLITIGNIVVVTDIKQIQMRI